MPKHLCGVPYNVNICVVTVIVHHTPYVQTYQFVSTSSAQPIGDNGYEYDCDGDGGSYDHVVVDADEDDGLMIHNPHHHVCIMLSAWAHRGDEAGVCCI